MDSPTQTIASLTEEVQQLRQRNAELEAIQEGQHHLKLAQSCVDGMPDLVLWVDPTAQIIYANDQACRWYGYSREELLERHWIDLQQTGSMTCQNKYWNRLLMKGSLVVEEWHVTRSGQVFPVEVVATLACLEDRLYSIRYVRDISKRRSTEEQLHRSQALFQEIFHHSPIGTVVLDMREAAAAVAELTSLGVSDVVSYFQTHRELLDKLVSGTPLLDSNVQAQELVEAFRPEDSVVLPLLGALAEGKPYFETDVASRRPQGEDQHWLVRFSFPQDSRSFERTLVHVIDITERKRAEDALRQKEQHLQTLFENVSDLIFQATPGGRFLSANPEGVRRLGYQSLEDLIESISDIGAQIYVVPEERRHVIAQLQEKGRINGYEFQFYTRQGDVRWGILNAVGVMDEAGQLLRIDGFVQDVTEQHTTLDKLHRLQDELAHVIRVSTMGEMATGLAHELNQPLASLKLYAQTCLDLLAGGVRPTELREPLQEIAQEAQRAAEIVLQLRQFVGRRPSRRSTVSINQLVQEVVKLAEYECRRSSVVLRLDLDLDLPPVVVDSILIQQVILNLLRNAVQALAEKATDQRSVMIKTALAEHAQARVAVHDSGPGVDSELACRMFDPFVTTKPSGMGMGLAISQTIVASHGGRLWYTPAPFGGSVFQFALPTILAESPDGK